MKQKLFRQVPFLIAFGVIALVCLVRVLCPGVFEQLEWKTFDWRVRLAARHPPTVATNLGFVFISDDSIAALNRGLLGSSYGLYWPRHVYGRLVRELSAQGAEAAAFDILFKEQRPDHAPVPVKDGPNQPVNAFLHHLHPGQKPVSVDGESYVESDDFFAWQLRRTGNAILAAEGHMLPLDLFRTNALTMGDIASERDSDGILRRVKAFRIYRLWHPLFLKVAADPAYGIDLGQAHVAPGLVILPRSNGEEIKVPVDGDGNFELEDFLGEKLPAGMPAKGKAFVDQRVWHMGIVLAAQALHLDLATAQVEPNLGRVVLRGAGGAERLIPIDPQGYFYINWSLTSADRRLTKESIESLLSQDLLRVSGRTSELTNRWKGKLVVVGSSATGNDLTDRGATPLEKDTLLVSKHWNVANSVLTGSFIHRSSLGTDLAVIVLLGVLTSFLTWQLRAFSAGGGVALLALGYFAAGAFLYERFLYWLPLVLPTLGALLLEHVCLVTYRVVFVERERRRVKSIFTKLVSPNVVNELLKAGQAALGGARRQITVLFADVRGFTELTDVSQEQAGALVRERQLAGQAAEACYDEAAREILHTVNLYLSTVGDTVKKHDGTLDKYIGDCVMAFWGAPTLNPQHGLACVRAAIEAQRAIHELNQRRTLENQQRELENRARTAAGLPAKPLLPVLHLGTGINTGMAAVGLMGSEAHIQNYTVFGREVNLASRLESASGRGRIFISEATHQELLRDDPALALACVALPAITVKGIRTAVNIYEVPWLPAGARAASDDKSNGGTSCGICARRSPPLGRL